MNKSTAQFIIDKWKIILEEYEKIREKRSMMFSKVQELCEIHQISRKQLKKYYQRWISSNKKDCTLIPQKRGPRIGEHRMLSKEQERIIIKIQRRFEAKPLDIWCLMKNNWKIHPSVKTIGRILKRYPQNKKKEIIHRYEKNIPGELIHCDTFDIPRGLFLDDKKRYLSGFIDDCTRLTYVTMIEGKIPLEAARSLLEAGNWFNLHGIEIERIMTDNGQEYTIPIGYNSKKHKHEFEILLHLANIKHIYTKPYTPKTNGKIERFWKILNEEYIHGLHRLTKEKFIEKLKQFMYFYNYQRMHGGIKYQTPLEKLNFVTETLG